MWKNRHDGVGGLLMVVVAKRAPMVVVVLQIENILKGANAGSDASNPLQQEKGEMERTRRQRS